MTAPDRWPAPIDRRARKPGTPRRPARAAPRPVLLPGRPDRRGRGAQWTVTWSPRNFSRRRPGSTVSKCRLTYIGPRNPSRQRHACGYATCPNSSRAKRFNKPLTTTEMAVTARPERDPAHRSRGAKPPSSPIRTRPRRSRIRESKSAGLTMSATRLRPPALPASGKSQRTTRLWVTTRDTLLLLSRVSRWPFLRHGGDTLIPTANPHITHSGSQLTHVTHRYQRRCDH